MTICVEERKAAIKRALVRLADLCGDANGIRFGAADLVDASPLGTTISELQEARLVKQVVFSSNPEPYALTVEGWFQAQRISGRFDSE
jgi:hypothetical protein